MYLLTKLVPTNSLLIDRQTMVWVKDFIQNVFGDVDFDICFQ